jgi:small multidrug resistance family-3 protein
MNIIIKSLLFFVLTGLFELGGTYLIWLWIRDHRSIWYGFMGSAVLIVYGILPTFQLANFGRLQAAYSGVFLMVALFWGWGIDKIQPDKFDIIGAIVALIGSTIIMFAPRS